MVSYLVGNKVLEFNKLIFIGVNGDDGNPGTESAPLKSVEKALSFCDTDNDAVVFLPGEYYLPVIHNDYYGDGFFVDVRDNPDRNKAVFIGQGKDSVFYCDSNLSERRDCSIATNHSVQSPMDFYRMNFKFTTKSDVNYESAISRWTNPASFYNCAIENIGSHSMSLNYYNVSRDCSCFYHCIVQANGKVVDDYTSNTRDLENSLFDWDFSNATNVKNKLVRAITKEDYLSASAPDLAASDGSVIGVYGGDYSWGAGALVKDITEKHQDESGKELKPDVVRKAAEGLDYKSLAPKIDKYFCIGHKIDGGVMQNGQEALIKGVAADHTVVFVYKLLSDITEPIDMKLHVLLKVGGKVNLTGYIWPVGKNPPKLVWSSEFASIASVDQNGAVTGVSVGKTKIFVRTEDGSWSGFARIKVVADSDDTELLVSVLLEVGESCVLFPEFEPEDVTTSVLWSSENSAVATVSPTGKVTAIAPGLVVITAKTADGKLSDAMYVTVKPL